MTTPSSPPATSPDARPLTRIILGRKLELPATAAVLCAKGQGQLIVCCSQAEYDRHGRQFLDLFNTFNASLLPLTEDATGHPSLRHLLAALGQTTITHLLVEPGPQTAELFLAQNFADRLWVFRSPDVMNDTTAPTAARVPYPPTATIPVGRDTLTEYLNPTSDVFFASDPSADFVLSRDAGAAG
jgi:riboflavin biosynthesis pyrimidine reductase